MIAVGSLDYALARMQSRLGHRPSEAVWTAIEHAREADALIDLARGTTLQAPLAHLGASRVIHEVEAGLRADWRVQVAELALWMPAAWRPALAWCAWLPELPWLRHWAEGRAPTAWVLTDPLRRDLYPAHGEPAQAPGIRLPPSHPLAPLAPALTDPPGLGRAWAAEFMRRLPAAARRSGELGPLQHLLDDYLGRSGLTAGREALRLRRHFEARLVALFRRHPLDPLAAFAWLGLAALDLDRLRGELVLRLALPHRSFAS